MQKSNNPYKCTIVIHHCRVSQNGLIFRSDTSVYFLIGSSVQTCTFKIPRNFWKDKIHVFRPTRSSGFSCYRVMVISQGDLLRITRSLVSHSSQLKVPFCSFIGVPLVFPLIIVCCIRIIRLLSLACSFFSSGLKNERWAP